MRLADLERIAARPAWITEGSYIWWIEKLLQTADKIIWLDLPWHITSWRIITRHIKADLAGNNPYSGHRRLLRFYAEARQYYRDDTLKETMSMDTDGLYNASTLNYQLLPYASKIIRCHRPVDVAGVLVKFATDNKS
jgi:adenylate kinase family enzyme